MSFVVQLLSRVQLFAAPWTSPCQASPPFTISLSLLNSCLLSRWCHPTSSSWVAPSPAHNLCWHQGLSQWVTVFGKVGGLWQCMQKLWKQLILINLRHSCQACEDPPGPGSMWSVYHWSRSQATVSATFKTDPPTMKPPNPVRLRASWKIPLVFEVPRVKNLKRHSLAGSRDRRLFKLYTPKVLIYLLLVPILQKSPKVMLSVWVRSTWSPHSMAEANLPSGSEVYSSPAQRMEAQLFPLRDRQQPDTLTSSLGLSPWVLPMPVF